MGKLLNGCNHIPKFLPFFGTMFMATFKSHWKNGFIVSKGGYEYTLVLMAVSIPLGLIGPGNYSLDAPFGIVQTSALLFGALAVAALLVDVIGLLISRSAAVAPSREGVQSSLLRQSDSERERQEVRNS